VNLRALLFALMAILASCASAPKPATVPVQIPPETWHQVDQEILSASKNATLPARHYATQTMDSWMDSVYQRTESHFIPWFAGYWTQQWLTLKVSWYKVSAKQGEPTAAQRLDAYLQEQYHERVLDPVSKQIDPEAVTNQATAYYIQQLGQQLPSIAERHQIPIEQFNAHLNEIPAIALAPPSSSDATLYQLVHAEPLVKLPAYVALIDRIHQAATGPEAGRPDAGISSVAIRSSEKLEASLAPRGAASAVAAVVGRVAGLMISVGTIGFGAITHQNERASMEEQMRNSLYSALNDKKRSLIDNPQFGVMSGVYYLAGQIEGSLGDAPLLPSSLETVAPDTPPPIQP
jgi:LysM repeat protein